jgi:hypothetical protein
VLTKNVAIENNKCANSLVTLSGPNLLLASSFCYVFAAAVVVVVAAAAVVVVVVVAVVLDNSIFVPQRLNKY